MKIYLASVLFFSPILAAQTSSPPAADPLNALSFLEGTWLARTGEGAAVKTSGKYTFRRELGGHVLARQSTSDPNCKGPVGFDCEHRDLLYVFPDGAGPMLKAIYFDSEGHVIHYDVKVSGPGSVVFESESAPGPRFRLTYQLQGASMQGKFQMQPPGSQDWRSYLEWSGPRE